VLGLLELYNTGFPVQKHCTIYDDYINVKIDTTFDNVELYINGTFIMNNDVFYEENGKIDIVRLHEMIEGYHDTIYNTTVTMNLEYVLENMPVMHGTYNISMYQMCYQNGEHLTFYKPKMPDISDIFIICVFCILDVIFVSGFLYNKFINKP